jgi:hypothetical protein
MQLFGPVGCSKYVPVGHFMGGEIIYLSFRHNFQEFYFTLHKGRSDKSYRNGQQDATV